MGFLASAAISIGLGVAIKLLFPPAPIKQVGPRVTDRSIRNSTYGKRIRYVEGTARIVEEDTNIIWSTGLVERVFVEEETVGGIFGFGGQKVETVEFKYFHSSAYLVCEGPVDDVLRIWFNKKERFSKSGRTRLSDEGVITGLIDLTDFGDSKLAEFMAEATGQGLGAEIRIYKGTATQNPDPLIVADKGVDNVSAHRGWCYFTVEDQPLADYGNQIPRPSVEVAGSVRALYPRQPINDPDGIANPAWVDSSGIENNALYLDPFEDIITTSEQGGDSNYGRMTATSLTALSAVFIEFSQTHQYRKAFTGIDNERIVSTRGANVHEMWVHSLLDGSFIYKLTDSDGVTPATISGGQATITMPYVVRAPGFGEQVHYLVGEGGLVGEFTASALNVFIENTAGTSAARFEKNTNVMLANSAWRGFIFSPFNDGRVVWTLMRTSTTLRMVQTEVVVTIGELPVGAGGGIPGAFFSEPKMSILKDWTIDTGSGGDIPQNAGEPNGWCIVEKEEAIIIGFDLFMMKVSMADGTILATNTTIGFNAPYNWTDTDKFAFIGSTDAGPPANNTVYEIDVTDLTITNTSPISNWFSDDGQPSLVYPTSSTYDPRSDSLIILRPPPGNPFGGRIFLDRVAGNSVPLDEVQGRLDGRAGLNIATQSDRTQLATDNVRWSTAAPTIRGAIEELTAIFRYEGVESDAQMKWIKRGNAPTITIPAADIGLSSDDEQMEETLRDESEVVSRYTLVYPDGNTDYQTGVQHSVRNLGPDETLGTRRELEEETDVILDATAARQLTEIKLYTASGERRGVKFNVLWTYLALDPTDVIVLMVPRASGIVEALNIRISEIIYGADLVMEITAVVENARTFTSTTAGFAGEFNQPTVILIRPATFLAMNLPLLVDGDTTFQQASRSYWTVLTQAITGAVFPGATGLVSRDGRIFETIASIGLDPAVGTILTALPDPTHPDGWNEDSVTIEMQSGIDRIVTQTEDDILNNHFLNLAAVFKADGTVELIRVQNITKINSGRITAQRFLRGRRGTDAFATGHQNLERIVFLEQARHASFLTAIDDINRTFTYKAVTIGTDLDEARDIAATYTGEDCCNLHWGRPEAICPCEYHLRGPSQW
jgi:hypothetical protein